EYVCVLMPYPQRACSTLFPDTTLFRSKDIRFQATAGPHKVGVAFRHRTSAESDDRLAMFVPGGGQDRIFRVSSFQISGPFNPTRSEEHTSELQSRENLVCRLLLEKKKQ